MWPCGHFLQNKRKEGLVINHKKSVEKMELISRQISPNIPMKPRLTQQSTPH
jgi:hypothetical protein